MMRSGAGRASAVCALGFTLALPVAAQTPTQRLALLIGSSAYAAGPALDACRTSVNGLAGALRRAGFVVTERVNPSNAQMGATLSEFSDTVKRATAVEVVSYVCGYTVTLDKRVFLLPASATLAYDTDVLSQGIVSRLFIQSATHSSVRGGLVLIDAVAWPGNPANAKGTPLATLVDASSPMAAGYAAVQSLTPLPAGMTDLAGAATAALATLGGRPSDWASVMRQLRQGLPDNAQRKVAMVDPRPTAATSSAVAAAAPIGRSGRSNGPLPGPEAIPYRAADIRRMQLALQRLGYYAGPVDGVAGADTAAAVRRFQHELGAEKTGQLTPGQTARLFKDSP